jgi:hypothetical protein
MSETETALTPRDYDIELAEIWKDIYSWRQKLAYAQSNLLHLAGAKYYYRGKKRVTDMTLDEAIEIVTQAYIDITNYKATHLVDDDDGYGPEIDWTDYKGRVATYDNEKPSEYLRKLTDVQDKLADLERERKEAEEAYTGWSRFFLVTSSPGHIHSSMKCSTCRWTTTFGWLPELSGKTEADAVDELGPTLCSVCFPSAPLDWTKGKKLTAAQAAKKVA